MATSFAASASVKLKKREGSTTRLVIVGAAGRERSPFVAGAGSGSMTKLVLTEQVTSV